MGGSTQPRFYYLMIPIVENVFKGTSVESSQHFSKLESQKTVTWGEKQSLVEASLVSIPRI